MRRILLAALAAAALGGCESKTNRERMNDAGPPPDTGNGKGLPAMKPPGEGGANSSMPPKAGAPKK